MSFLKKPPIFLAWLAIIIITIVYIFISAKSLPANNPQYIAIEDTLRKYLAIDAEARYTLDDSRLGEVLANDPRGSYSVPGGNVRAAKAVRWYTGNPLIGENHIGMLDYWRAYYAYNRQVKRFYEAALAKGVNGSAANAGQISPEPLPEVRQLMEESGFQVASMPSRRPKVIAPQEFTIQSVKVFMGAAYVVVDYPYGKQGLTFVKRGGQWYLVGCKNFQGPAG